AAAFASITRTGLVADVRYLATTAGLDALEIRAKLRATRPRDLVTQMTHLGPHRDDVGMFLDEREAGSFASQGQLRAILLAWKTAELTVLRVAHGDAPILLLDDVSSELDPSRNEFLFEHLATLAGQCFITTTDGAHVLLSRDRADYRIEAGKIHESS
ncbi:MAG: DNA replication and repair protein RecF, partial [Proteobacteria bacterium]|nr:DNA replication and repair protein RecF [Pseudomonadota bacterium]